MNAISNRQQSRADWHDYRDGVYFVTICSTDKKHIFGEIADDEMHLSELGGATDCLNEIPNHHPDAEILSHVVMPNHIHIIIAITGHVGTRYIASAPAAANKLGCLKAPRHGEICNDFHHNSRLAVIVGSFKAAVTRLARTRYIASLPIWQPRFHEHIIRDRHALDNIMTYIDENVSRWDKDCFNNTETNN